MKTVKDTFFLIGCWFIGIASRQRMWEILRDAGKAIAKKY